MAISVHGSVADALGALRLPEGSGDGAESTDPARHVNTHAAARERPMSFRNRIFWCQLLARLVTLMGWLRLQNQGEIQSRGAKENRSNQNREGGQDTQSRSLDCFYLFLLVVFSLRVAGRETVGKRQDEDAALPQLIITFICLPHC